MISCGDSEATLEQYFAEVNRITEEAENRIQELTGDFSGGIESFEAAREVYPAYVRAYQDFVDGIDRLNPPSQAAAAHREFVAASKDL